MAQNQKVAMVTGGNRGCGLAFVRRLCQLPFPGTVYLTSRDEARGREAVEQLKGEGLNPSYQQLDLGDSASIRRFVDFIKRTHGGIDVVIANGAMPFPKQMTVAEIEATLRVNNKGNAELCCALMPLLRPQARMLIVSSGFGQVVHLGPELRKRFLATDTMTVAELNGLLDEYMAAVKDGSFKEKGWPDWCNKMSKIGLVALARILAREASSDRSRPGILVNAVCPGTGL
ncbi:hypothetical protein BaRGS_00020456 [Batillaria attramentaria]|uniref:Carbonyl reductase n=1 Tax=Batillaria attramentaria TaxID=370345 RepID=A0ABD0KMA6_9CAEN